MGDKIRPDLSTKRHRSPLRKLLLMLVVIPLFAFLVLAILGLIIGNGNSTDANGKQTAQQTQNQPKPTAAPQPQISQTVSDAGFNFLINSIKCGETHLSTGGTVYYYSDAQGQYCRLNVTITNTGNTANSINIIDQYAFNAQGQRYDSAGDATSTAAGYAMGNPLDDNINPGNSITGDIVFDVPVGVTPTVAELHGNRSSQGVRINLQ